MDKQTSIKAIPIVTILGHVDHGKTTILDQIRSANMADGEAGGITQKISIFTVKGSNVGTESDMTFVDTPGHEAFDLMRSRGGSIADIVLLIVAADDGLMPQTKESIKIILQSPAHPIVVINKIDLPNTDIERIKRELSVEGIQVEGYGGAIPVVEVSGKTGLGIDKLLQTISLVVEVEGLVDRGELPEGVNGRAVVLESVKDKSKGNLSSVIVTQGEFNKGDFIGYLAKGQHTIEKVKGFVSEDNDNISQLQAGHGGKILGLSELVSLGSHLLTLEKNDKKLIQKLIEIPSAIVEEIPEPEVVPVDGEAPIVGEDWLAAMLGAEMKEKDEDSGGELNVIIKTASEGSMEALLNTLANLDIEGYTVKIVESGVGEITMRDVEMAQVTKSILLGFEVSVDSRARAEAESKRVGIRTYELIYKLKEELADVLTMMATPHEIEEDLGNAEIKQIFTLTNGDKVIGGKVLKGIIKKGEKCYIVRNDDIVGEGKITSLKRNKDEIKESTKGNEFGAIITPTPEDVQEGDQIHCFKMVKVG